MAHHGSSSRRRGPVATAWALGALGAALVLAGVLATALTGHGAGTAQDVRHVSVFVLTAGLVFLRAATVPSGRRIWVIIGLGALCDLVAQALWTFVYDSSTTSPADALFGVAYVLLVIGLSLILRRRVGDALRTFSFDAIGITVFLTAIGSAILLVPIMRHSDTSQVGGALCVFYPAADAALWSVIFAVSSFTGRRQGRQDRLLGAAFLVLCLGDVLLVLGQAGWLDLTALRPWSGLAWESSGLFLAAAAWARPSPAGQLRVGGWWESGPTLLWTAFGAGVLVAARAFELPAMVVVLGAATLVLAALRGRRVMQEVRELVVVRAESLVDELTGAANQRALFAELALLTREDGEDGQRVALMICHLEGFDELTDTLGHEAAGDLLRAVAARLGPVAPGTLARLHGDEFATIVEDGDPLAVAAALEAALARPVSMDGIAVILRPVFGYARFPEDATTPAGLARRADVARRDAKDRGL
ncbi:MAG: bifunctional diguanylate cyclase/phosphodiesterase, partial [Conexibacter sp.]|nr:bifunctional diguanylate cyclase/phosphodiesterase [Conexibacter sp.]